MAYKKLDLSKLKFADTPISMQEALKDVTPFELPGDVLNGERKMVIDKATPIEGTTKIGVSISYV